MFHVTFKVDVQKLEHEIEFLVRMHNVQQSITHLARLHMQARERARERRT